VKPLRPRLALLSAAALSSAAALAQTAPAPKSNAAAGEPVQLSSFVVQTDQDKGYAAMNSTGATRINMAIKDIPVNLTVITREFLDDSLAFDFQDALAYTAGVITRRDDRTAIIVRGFQIGEPFVNNFRRIDYQDSSNIERLEVIRGAAAVLYGITSAGGTVNVITKKPVYGKTFGEVKGTFGSYSFRRAEADYNVPAGDKLAFRITGAHQYSEGYRSPTVERTFDKDETNVLTPSVAYRPFKGTNITVEYEHMHRDNGSPEGGDNHVLMQVVGGRNVPIPTIYNYPIGTTFRGSYSVDNITYKALTAIVDQRITDDLSLRLSAYRVDYDWPRGGLGSFSFAQPSGQPWADPVTGAPSWRGFFQQNREQWNQIYSYRADAAWKFDLGRTKHQLLVGGQYYEDTNRSTNVRDMLPGTRTTQFRYYPLSDKRPDAGFPTNVNYQLLNSGTRNRDENSQAYVVHTGKFFDDKLITLAGLFRIKLDNINRPANPADDARDPSLHAFGPATKFQNKTSAPQLGLLYKPSERASLYTLYSESVAAVETGRSDKNGNPLDPVFANNIEAGVKLDLTRRLVGTIGGYRAEIQNSVAFNNDLPNPFNPTADPNISPRGAYEQVGKRLVSGLVADLVWSPTSAIETRVGWQHVFQNEITDDTNKAIIGRKHGRHIRDFVTFYGRYKFAENGPLAGFSANLGLEWRGKQLREYAAFNANQPTYFQAYWNADGAIRYGKRLGRYNYTFALNAKNLLEREAPLGYQPNTVVPFYFRTDREFYLTASVKF
jgi:outer membrane receptor protein involved in Fe transport